jgi:hypothetical protein
VGRRSYTYSHAKKQTFKGLNIVSFISLVTAKRKYNKLMLAGYKVLNNIFLLSNMREEKRK